MICLNDQVGCSGAGVPAFGRGDSAPLRRRPGQPVAVRRRREPGGHDQTSGAHVALPAGLPFRRQHQILRLSGHRRPRRQQRDRGRRPPVRHSQLGNSTQN